MLSILAVVKGTPILYVMVIIAPDPVDRHCPRIRAELLRIRSPLNTSILPRRWASAVAIIFRHHPNAPDAGAHHHRFRGVKAATSVSLFSASGAAPIMSPGGPAAVYLRSAGVLLYGGFHIGFAIFPP